MENKERELHVIGHLLQRSEYPKTPKDLQIQLFSTDGGSMEFWIRFFAAEEKPGHYLKDLFDRRKGQTCL